MSLLQTTPLLQQQPTIYYKNDFNFTGMSIEQLRLLCLHQLPIQTSFVKLVIDLFFHPKMKEWITHTQSPSLQILSEKQIIDQLVTAVEQYASHAVTIHLEDATFWKTIVDAFLQLDPSFHESEKNEKPQPTDDEVFENHVLRTVNKTLRHLPSSKNPIKKKSVKQKTYWI